MVMTGQLEGLLAAVPSPAHGSCLNQTAVTFLVEGAVAEVPDPPCPPGFVYTDVEETIGGIPVFIEACIPIL